MKTPTPIPKEKTIYGSRLLIWRNPAMKTPTASHLWAVLPTADYDTKETQLHDWKADFEKASIYVRGAIYRGNGCWQQFEGTYPCETEEVPLLKPGRNFAWSEMSGEWRNPKTGERRRAF